MQHVYEADVNCVFVIKKVQLKYTTNYSCNVEFDLI